jgi:hypothetical protein
MILGDAISLVLDEYPGMKAIGAAESSDVWIVGLDFAASTSEHPVPGTPSIAVEKTSGVLHSLVPGTDEFWHYMTGARKVPIPQV